MGFITTKKNGAQRTEPPRIDEPPAAANHGLHPDAIKFADSFSRLKEEVAFLRSENNSQREELSLEREKSRRLAQENDDLRQDRDFYMRHSVAMVTRLRVIKLAIADAEEAARASGFAPPGTLEGREQAAAEQVDAAVEQLGKTLGADNRQEEAA